MTVRLGDIAPNFTARTTEGIIDFYKWKGNNWAVLFSHPKDFTPVCTSELGRVAALKDEFEKRNTKVIGLSVDSLESHRSWMQDIKEVTGHALNFPLIADHDRKVSGLYDMMRPDAKDTLTVRSVFIIGSDNKVKRSQRACSNWQPAPPSANPRLQVRPPTRACSFLRRLMPASFLDARPSRSGLSNASAR